MAGGENFNFAGTWLARRANIGDKSRGIEIARDGGIDGGERLKKTRVRSEIGA